MFIKEFFSDKRLSSQYQEKKLMTNFWIPYTIGANPIKKSRKIIRSNFLSGLNFINGLRTTFTRIDPKSVKRYWQLDWVLTLWEATGVKAVLKYVDEIDPWCISSI